MMFNFILNRSSAFKKLVDVLECTIGDISRLAALIGNDIRELKIRIGLVERKSRKVITRKRLHSLRMYERRNLNRLFM